MFQKKVILITGGSGSFGTYATKKLLSFNPKEIRIYSRTISKHRILAEKIKNDPKVKFIVGNVQDEKRLIKSTERVDIIIHAAANKYIELCQEDPIGAIATNVIGTQNVINAAVKNKVKFVINLSADKAVYPTSVYGATKQLSENLIITASKQSTKTVFVNVRYSNVLGSSGSVTEVFKQKLSSGKTVEIFDKNAQRLVLTQDEVWELVEKAFDFNLTGTTFVYLAPKLYIIDLASILKSMVGKGKVTVTNHLRPGERTDAYLIAREEAKRTFMLQGQIAVILPQSYTKTVSRFKKFKGNKYDSNDAKRLNKWQISKLLVKIL